MAMCLRCGWIMHEEDAPLHICKVEDIPEKGKPKKPMTAVIA